MERVNSLFFVMLGRTWTFFLVSVIIGVVAAIGVTIFLIILKTKENNENKKIKGKIGQESVCIVNLREENAYRFYFNNLRSKKNITLRDFLDEFSTKDRTKIRTRLEDLGKQNFQKFSENNLFVAEMIVTNDRNPKKVTYNRCLIECVGKDIDSGILNLDLVRLPNIPTKNDKDKSNDFHKYLYEDVEIKSIYNIQDTSKNCLLNIRCFRKKGLVSDTNDNVLRYYMLNEIYDIVKDKTSFNYFWFDEFDNKSLFFLTNKAPNIYVLSNLIKKLQERLQKLFDILGLSRFYDVVVVGAKRKELSSDFEKGKVSIKDYSLSIYENNKKMGTFSSEQGQELAEEATKNELTKIIKNSMLGSRYLSLYKVNKKSISVYGYLAVPYLKNSSFKSVEVLKTTAVKYDMIKDVSSLVARKTVPTFNSEKNSNLNKLVIYLNPHELPTLTRIYSHLNNIDNTSIIFVLRNAAVAAREKEPTFYQSLNTIKSKLKCDFYIDINTEDYILKDATYKLFDGFVMNSQGISGGNKLEGREFVKVRNLYEKFAEFKKPIIATNFKTWQEIEMLAKIGVSIFGSEVIVQESENLIPISQKSQKRLINMYKK